MKTLWRISHVSFAVRAGKAKPALIKKRDGKRAIEYLYGLNPISSALAGQKRQMYQLTLDENKENEAHHRRHELAIKAQELNLPVVYATQKKIEKLVRGQPHQGAVLECGPIKVNTIKSVDEIYERSGKIKGNTWVFLDQITDPHNFGALARSAFFYNVDGVFTTMTGSCPINSTVSKVSTGAIELIDVYYLHNIERLMQKMAVRGWKILATEAEETKAKKLIPLDEYIVNPDENVVVIFGSEGRGISSYLKRSATHRLSIRSGYLSEEFVYPVSLVDSLNVSVSAGIILNHFKKRIKKS